MGEVFSVYRLEDGTLCCNWGTEMLALLDATNDQGEHADGLIDFAEEWLADAAELDAAQCDRGPTGGDAAGGSVHESAVPAGDAPDSSLRPSVNTTDIG